MSTLLTETLLVAVVGVAAAWVGLRILSSTTASAFVLAFIVGTNGSAVMRQTFGVPEVVLPFAALVIFVAILRRLSGNRTTSTPSWLAFAGIAALALLYLSAALGPFVSAHARSASDSFQLLSEHMVIALALIALCWRPPGLRGALFGLVAAGATLSLVTNVQWATGTRSSDAAGFGSWNQETIGGIGNTLRAAGPFDDDPNAYALYLVVMASTALGVALWAGMLRRNDSITRSRRDVILTRVMLVAMASMVLAIVHTASRGGILAFSTVVVAALVIRGLDRRTIGTAALVGAILVVGPFGIGDRLMSLNAAPSLAGATPEVDSGLLGRASEMRAAVDMFTDHPIAGVGFGTYNDRYLDYSREIGLDGRFETRSAHSFPLEVAAEQGLIGLATWTAFTVFALMVVRRLRRQRPDVGLPLSLALLAFATASLFLHDVHPRLLWSLVAMVVAASAMVDRRPVLATFDRTHDRIRVAMVIQAYVPAIGGAERQLANLMPLLVDRGIEPLVVTRAMPGRARFDEIDGIPVERVPVVGPKPIRSLMFVVQARAILRRFDPDVVHAFDTLTPSSIGLGHAQQTGCPLVTKILRSGELGDLHRLGRKPFGSRRRRRLLRHADSFVAISTDIETELRALGVDDDRISTIPNGVDTEKFHPPKTRVRHSTKRPLTVVATGRLAPEKRLVELAEQWHRVTAVHPKTELAIVGDGPDAPRLAAFDDVRVYGRRDDIDDMLRDADAYVSVSSAEGLSNSLLEAMSTGLACVVTNVGGVRDVITTSDQGVAVSVDDIGAVVDELIAVLGDLPRRRSMRRASRRRVRRAFSLDTTAADLVALYRRLHSGRPTTDIAEADGPPIRERLEVLQ